MCAGCHFWAHQNPTDFTYWLEEHLGKDVLEKLHDKNIPTYGKFDWDTTHEFLKSIWGQSQ